MLALVVVAIIALTGSVHAGYIYPRANIEFEMPKIGPKLHEEIGQKTIHENVAHQTHEDVTSYSVPYEDYFYLRQQKTSHQQAISDLDASKKSTGTHFTSPFVKISNINTLSAPVVKSFNGLLNGVTYTPKPISYQSNLAVNSLQNINIPAINIPNAKLAAAINQQSNLPVNIDQHIDIPAGNLKSEFIPVPLSNQINSGFNFSPHNILTDNIPSLNFLTPINQQSNLELDTLQQINIPAVKNPSVNLGFTTEHHTIHHGVSGDFNGPINIQNAVPPKITTDIYFHVPPPDMEETALQTVPPRKKVYKIIFIKVPSQDTKNTPQLKDNVYSQVAPIEDKTIIYVLSKKPEPQPVFLPKSIPSEHQVLFVKYSGNPSDAVTQIDENLGHPESELLPAPRLQPGLINGN